MMIVRLLSWTIEAWLDSVLGRPCSPVDRLEPDCLSLFLGGTLLEFLRSSLSIPDEENIRTTMNSTF